MIDIIPWADHTGQGKGWVRLILLRTWSGSGCGTEEIYYLDLCGVLVPHALKVTLWLVKSCVYAKRLNLSAQRRYSMCSPAVYCPDNIAQQNTSCFASTESSTAGCIWLCSLSVDPMKNVRSVTRRRRFPHSPPPLGNVGLAAEVVRMRSISRREKQSGSRSPT
jgi:hypothetical protein